MGGAAKVYAEELHRLQYGHPLWWPEHTKGPGGRERGIEIGDVGYIDTDGAFHPLFNITHETEHELNAGKTPPGFTPFVCEDGSIETKTPYFQVGPLSSSSVKGHQSWAAIEGKDPISGGGMALSYRFECSKKQGAILMLWDDATKTELQRQEQQFQKYMKTYHDSWYLFASEKLGITCTREDIILVRGFVKTSRWTVAALLGESDTNREVTLDGQFSSLFGVAAGCSSQTGWLSSVEQRSGPTTRLSSRPALAAPADTYTTIPALKPSPRDQCVFLNYYKIKQRLLLPNGMVAAAGPFNLPGPNGNDEEPENLLAQLSLSDDDTGVQTEHVLPKPLNPLDIVLDYILECSDARVAIASYNDLEAFELMRGPLAVKPCWHTPLFIAQN